MSSARKKVMEALEDRGGAMSLGALSKELVLEGALGFGVEPIDVVSALAKEGQIALANDQVSLRRNRAQ
jgi:hypothetical protein